MQQSMLVRDIDVTRVYTPVEVPVSMSHGSAEDDAGRGTETISLLNPRELLMVVSERGLGVCILSKSPFFFLDAYVSCHHFFFPSRTYLTVHSPEARV